MKNYLTFSLGLMLTIMVDAGAFSQVADTTAINSMWFNEGGYVRGITSARLIGLLELSLGLASLVMAIRAKKKFSYSACENRADNRSYYDSLLYCTFIHHSRCDFRLGQRKSRFYPCNDFEPGGYYPRFPDTPSL